MSNQIIDFETLHAMNLEDWQAPNALTAFTHVASTVGVCHQWDAGKQFDALDVFGTMIELSNFDCACALAQKDASERDNLLYVKEAGALFVDFDGSIRFVSDTVATTEEEWAALKFHFGWYYSDKLMKEHGIDSKMFLSDQYYISDKELDAIVQYIFKVAFTRLLRK